MSSFGPLSKEVKAEGQKISSPDMSICPLYNLSLKVIQILTTVWEKGTKMRASGIIIKCSIIMHVYYLLHVWYRNYMIHKLKTQKGILGIGYRDCSHDVTTLLMHPGYTP